MHHLYGFGYGVFASYLINDSLAAGPKCVSGHVHENNFIALVQAKPKHITVNDMGT